MMMYRVVVIDLCCLITSIIILLIPSVRPSKQLIILLDGFRWDYFNIHGAGLRGFPKMFEKGTKAEYTIVDFPTLSYPNYYTIMTGLYDDYHGMIANFMYDEKEDAEFLIGGNADYSQSYWWDGGDPVWITATRQRKQVYMYYWPNCEVVIRGLLPTHCTPYTSPPSMEDFSRVVREGMSVLANNQADLVGIYFELTDYYGHWYGPRSSQMRQLIRDVDEVIYKLLEDIEKRHLQNEIDLVIFSDHGMTKVSPERVVRLEEYINTTDVERILEHGAFMCIWPKEGSLDLVYNNLKYANEHMNVYKKEDTPAHWFLRSHDRIPPIIISMELGWYILKPNETYSELNDTVSFSGTHGYDNKEMDMRGIFVATGPSFKEDFQSQALHVVDIYQMLCKSLGIQPSPHNGSWSRVAEMWRHSAANSHLPLHWMILTFWVIVFIF